MAVDVSALPLAAEHAVPDVAASLCLVHRNTHLDRRTWSAAYKVLLLTVIALTVAGPVALEEGPSGVASSVGRVCAGVFVVEATPDTEVDVEASTAQDDEDDDGYGYGGEMITDTRPLRARAHRPRQAVTIRRDQACPHGARRPARCTACSAASSSAETSTAMGRPS